MLLKALFSIYMNITTFDDDTWLEPCRAPPDILNAVLLDHLKKMQQYFPGRHPLESLVFSQIMTIQSIILAHWFEEKGA